MKREYYRKLLSVLKRYLWWFVGGIVAVIVFDGATLLIPWILKIAIEALKDIDNAQHSIFYYALLIMSLAIGGFVFRIVSRLFLFGAARYIEYDLREELFERLLKLSPSSLIKFRTGDLISRASNDLNTIKMFIGFGFLTIISTGFTYIVALFAMLKLSLTLTFYSFIPLPFIIIVVKKVTPKMYLISKETQERLGEISSMVQESVSGVQTVKAFVQEDAGDRRFYDISRHYYNARIRMVKYMGLIFPLMGMLGGIGTLIVLWKGGEMVINKEITLGDFVAFNSYLGMLIWPSIALGWIFTLIQRGLSSFERVCDVLTAPILEESTESSCDEKLSGDIEVKNLSFSYDSRNENGNTQKVLKDINLTIEEGETLAIVGPTGSGKTTFAKLLTRLLEVPPDTIFIGGKDISKLSFDSLRKTIGYVPQEGFIFHNTIRENVAYGLEGDASKNDDLLKRALKLSDFMKEVELFPKKLETEVGERGITLSGGQRQRLTIARMLVCDPEIIVLDDSLSSVDTHTEKNILSNIKDILEKKTSIIITHRISPLKYADRIAVIEDGRITEIGTHNELMAKGESYFRLYNRQAIFEEMEEL
ncbi:MAG: ABC transporter ATP-binding protein [Candidatus Schekmanbacteria bacterium]|nr:MAG: ABC transporter ATP-binding protein [Candidatus Schekmanbacteria bacterium]